MQPWNQWGVQPNSYSMPGYPGSVQPPVAPQASGVSGASGTQQYPVPYQWPNYSQPGATNPGVAGVNAWQQQQQQWDQWQQWQQQYAQWQQQYGKEYMAAMQAGQNPNAPPAPPTEPAPAAPSLPPNVNKRSGDEITATEAKKSKSDQDNETAIQAVKTALEEMAEAEKQFDEQFNNWESQFNAWREENANHPDTEQYKAYESKWTSWRTQLLTRREQMKKKKDAKLAELEKLQATVATSIATPAEVKPMQPPINPYQQGMYGNMNFPMGFNQQGYNMFGQPNMFPPVPPPVMPGSALLPVPQGKPLLGDAPKISPKEGGIPGLDLINSSHDGNNVNFNNLPPISLAQNVQETIQTPADSKPFDFPPPGKMPPMMGQNKQQMNVPPPGFRNQMNPKGFMGNVNQPPPMKPPLKELIPGLRNQIDNKNDDRNQDFNFQNPPPNNFMGKDGFKQNFNQNFNQNKFNQPNNFNQGSNFNRDNNFTPGNFNQSKFPMNKGNFNNSQSGRQEWGNPLQKPPLLPTPAALNSPNSNSGGNFNKRESNFEENERLDSSTRNNPPFGNDFPNFQDKQNSQGMKQFPQGGSNFPQGGPPTGTNAQPPTKDFRFPPEAEKRIEPPKPDYPVHQPVIIYDYYHQPAELGVPEMYEPWSMIDYAHAPSEFNEDSKTSYEDKNKDYGRGNAPWRNVRHDDRPWEDHKKNRDDHRFREREDFRRDDDRRRRDDRGRDDRARDMDRRNDQNRRDDKRKDRAPDDKYRDDRRDRGNDRDKRLSRKSRSRSKSAEKIIEGPMKIPDPPNLSSFEQSLINPVHAQMTVMIDDLISDPGRNTRPPRIVIILRGPPGSGKSFVAKLIKGKEVQMGGSAPRILSLDDYFMVEVDKANNEDGRKSLNNKVMEYEYEAAMEPQYRDSLVKSFKKTLNDGYFPFIIIDAVNDKVRHYEEISSFAKIKGFQVYISEMEFDLQSCLKRNTHNRPEKDIQDIINGWEKTPSNDAVLDIRSLLQDASIMEVNMEDTEEAVQDSKTSDVVETETDKKDETENDEKDPDNDDETSLLGSTLHTITSKWDDLDSRINKLDRLDGLSKNRKPTATIKDWLQLPEDYFEDSAQTSQGLPGDKKRVRWADLEERREQEKMRAIGFVVGQTDWSRMMDPTCGQHKLAQTKYI